MPLSLGHCPARLTCVIAEGNRCVCLSSPALSAGFPSTVATGSCKGEQAQPPPFIGDRMSPEGGDPSGQHSSESPGPPCPFSSLVLALVRNVPLVTFFPQWKNVVSFMIAFSNGFRENYMKKMWVYLSCRSDPAV